MGFDFKIETQPGYLQMTYEGHYESSLAGKFTNQVVEACEKHQPSKLLVDFRKVDGQLTTMDRFNLAVIFAIKYLKGRMAGTVPSCRFALVGNHPFVDPNRFGETVLVNRGINAKVFTEMKEALVWLGVEPAAEKTTESSRD